MVTSKIALASQARFPVRKIPLEVAPGGGGSPAPAPKRGWGSQALAPLASPAATALPRPSLLGSPQDRGGRPAREAARFGEEGAAVVAGRLGAAEAATPALGAAAKGGGSRLVLLPHCTEGSGRIPSGNANAGGRSGWCQHAATGRFLRATPAPGRRIRAGGIKAALPGSQGQKALKPGDATGATH